MAGKRWVPLKPKATLPQATLQSRFWLTYTYDADGRRTATAGSLAAVALPANVSGGSKTACNAGNEQTKFNGTALSCDADGNLIGDGTNPTLGTRATI